MASPLIFNGRRAKMLTQDGILRADGSIIDNDGVPNLIKNGHAEINVTGWTVSKNTVAASRPDSGFVTSSTNITWTRNTTNPIDGQADFLYTKDAANRQGEQVYCGFTVAKKYRAKVLQIEVDYLVNSGTFSAGSSSTDSDVIVYIYDVTNSTFIEPSSFKFLSNSSTIADKFVANFQTSATGSSYRILFHQATTSSSAFAVQFKEVRVSPCNYVYGTPISDWVSYTPTFGAGFGTVSTSSFYSRRVGDSLQVKGKWTNGTVAGSAATITVGYAGSNANVTIDTSKVSTNGIIGTAQTSLTSTTQFGVYPIAPSSNGTAISFTVQNSTTAFGSGAQNGNIIAASASQNSVEFSVPITGWSSSTQVSDGYDGRQIAAHAHKNASDQTGVNPNASFVKITFGSTASSGGGYDQTASFDTTNSKFTAPSSGKYSVKSNITLLATNILADEYGLVVYKNGSFYKVLDDRTQASTTVLNLQGSTTLDLVAGDYLELYLYGNGNNSASTLTIAGNVKNTWFAIEKLSSPQTMSATEVVAASYKISADKTPSASNPIDYDTKIFDTHNAVTTGSAWKFTAPVQGLYRVTTTNATSTTGGTLDLYVNGSQDRGMMSMADTSVRSASATVSLLAGGYISINPDSASKTFTGTKNNTIYIERIK